MANKQIKLDSGIDIDGTSVKSLTMREPTVADQLAASEVNGNSAMQEITLIANLCEVTPEDVKKLTLKDYRKVQEAFAGFTE